MARKWFQLVGEDGKALTSAGAVVVDIEDVDTLRDAVKEKCPNTLANVDASDLTVFENRAKYDAEEPLTPGSSIEAFGPSEHEALIVVVPDADDGDEVLYAVIKIVGEDPEDEKGCLSTGAHVWVCYLIGIYLVLTAMNAILDVWKTSCRTRSKERTPLLPLSKNQKKRMKKKRKRCKWWSVSW